MSRIHVKFIPPSGVPITVTDILAGVWGLVTGNVSLERFRDALQHYFGVKHCFFASSGRVALCMLLTAYKQLSPERDEVVLPAYTSFSVPSAVVNAGLKVALYDLNVQTLGPDSVSLEKAITDRTLCIVVCHLYGYPCDMDAVREVASRRGIPVIDDAAQAMGATYKGKYAGTLGDAGLFSLSRGKNISTVDGGIVVTDSAELAQILSRAKLAETGVTGLLMLLIKAVVLSVLLRPCFYCLPAQLPFLNLGASYFEPDFPLQRYTPFQAAIGRRMLERLKSLNSARVTKANTIMQGLGNAGSNLFVKPIAGVGPVFLRLPILNDTPQPRPIPEMGIVTSYPVPLNEIDALKPHLMNSNRCFPGAKMLAQHLLTLPTHGFVRDVDIKRIVALFGMRDTC